MKFFLITIGIVVAFYIYSVVSPTTRKAFFIGGMVVGVFFIWPLVVALGLLWIVTHIIKSPKT